MSKETPFCRPVVQNLIDLAALAGFESDTSPRPNLKQGEVTPKSQAVKSRRAANKRAAKSRKQQRGK